MANAGKRGGGGKWLFLGGLLLAAVVAVEAGWAGFGWAQLRSAIWPRDESLLAWIPGDTGTVAVLDPHQIKLEDLGPEGGTVRTALQRTRDDWKKATGIDLAFDVDKLAISATLVVARGRFDGKKLAERLATHRYVLAEHEGYTYLVRHGDDAIAAIDDSVLLYGDEDGVRAGITAHVKGTSLEKNEQVTTRLRALGWDHATMVTMRITDDQPSLRQILSGSTGPRAVSVAATTLRGLDLDAQVEAASPSAAQELATLLDEKRKGDLGWASILGPEGSKLFVDAAKKATITADPTNGMVKIHVHLEPAQVETISKSLGSSKELAEAYKTVRLIQLLSPIPM